MSTVKSLSPLLLVGALLILLIPMTGSSREGSRLAGSIGLIVGGIILMGAVFALIARVR